MFQVIAAMGEFERELMRERVRAGLRNARSNGRKLGRLCITVDTAGIGQLRAQACTVREIAGDLGFSRSLVHKTLANSRLLGAAIAAD
jgi:putative DNA-invertase from lambdoid prophage Rac